LKGSGLPEPLLLDILEWIAKENAPLCRGH
jgi:hypothetical protein